jgi:hypothetical protein
VKHCLKRTSFSSEEEFLFESHEILKQISSTTMLGVFEESMEKLVWVAAYENYFFAKPKFNRFNFFQSHSGVDI